MGIETILSGKADFAPLARCAGIFLLTACGLAAQTASQPDVSGTWIEQSNGDTKWVLTEKDDTIHVQEMTGDKIDTEFTCPLNGQECSAKIAGHSEKMMVYYNGDKLVEISEGRDGASKKRLTVSADGKTLSVELVPLSSSQKTETLQFRRQTT
jgi:hypothetical protein